MRFRHIYFLLIFALLSAGCGAAGGGEQDGSVFDLSVATQVQPVVLRVNPTSGRAGDTITVFGFGFSSEARQNIVLTGGKGANALTYALSNPPVDGEVEQLTFQVPSGATAGTGPVTVVVFENVSNTDVQFTVNP